MIWCKKKAEKGILWWMELIFAIFGAMAAIYFLYKCMKKYMPSMWGKKKGIGLDFPDLDLTLDEMNVHGGECHVVTEDDDRQSRGNAVVNSENRMLNIENEDEGEDA